MRFVRLIVLCMALLAFAAPAHAQEKNLRWTRYDASLNVQRNGTMQVTETEQIQFLSGTWQNGGRWIPLDRVDSISNVQVYAVDNGSRTPLEVETQNQGDKLEILWHFPLSGPGDVRTFQLQYTVTGVVRQYANDDQLRWIAVPSQRQFPVDESTVTLTLPGNLSPQQLKLASYPARLGGSEKPTANGAIYTVRNIPSGDGFEIRAQFPPGLVVAPKPSWQQQADRQDYLNQNVKPQNDIILLSLGLAIPVVGFVGLLFLWLTRGKDPVVGSGAQELTTPPSDLPAPLVGVLLDERADAQDVVSALMSLSERGIIRITEVQNDKLYGSHQDYKLELLNDHPSDLRPYERTILNVLFPEGNEAMLSDVRSRFTSAIPTVRDQLYEEATRAGLFNGNPEKVRHRYRALGIGILVLGVIFGCGGLSVLSSYAHPFFITLPAVGLAVLGFALMTLSRALPARTLNGAYEASRWLAFRNYLAHIERTPDIAQDKGIFERYLSYATAFNLGHSWLRKFAAVGTALPAWYQAGYGGPVGTYGGRGYRRGGGYWGGPVIIVPPFGGYGGGGGNPGGAGAPGGNGGQGGGDLFDNTGLFDFGSGKGPFDNAAGGLGDLIDMASDAFGGGGGWGGGGGGGFGGGSGGGGAGFS